MQHEYAFDVKLAAVVRVKADSMAEAVQAMEATIDAMEPCSAWIDGFNGASKVKLTEVSLDVDDCGPQLFELDGVEVS